MSEETPNIHPNVQKTAAYMAQNASRFSGYQLSEIYKAMLATELPTSVRKLYAHLAAELFIGPAPDTRQFELGSGPVGVPRGTPPRPHAVLAAS